MANICDNKFYFCCSHHYLDWKKRLIEELDKHFEFSYDADSNDSDNEGGWIEGWFDSRWNFPIEVLQEIFPDSLEEDENGKVYLEQSETVKDDVYFRCLSEEYGCGYVAMNIYDKGYWKDEQCFDL